MLATLEVGFDPVAAEFAVDAAVEAGQPLIVANVVEMPLGPMCVLMGYGALDPPDDDAARLRAPAELAQALGVEVERLRVRSPHPLDALVELVAERAPGLFVFGPDRVRLKPRLYRRAVKKIRAGVGCLVWLPE
jgi:nucleotide-binding universal stress UspA family protein